MTTSKKLFICFCRVCEREDEKLNGQPIAKEMKNTYKICVLLLA